MSGRTATWTQTRNLLFQMARKQSQKITLNHSTSQVKARVHPWIRLNRVIRDIPECSIIAGNQNTNLRQCIFSVLEKYGEACRCVRCREVRDWPEPVDKLRLCVRRYRSSEGEA